VDEPPQGRQGEIKMDRQRGRERNHRLREHGGRERQHRREEEQHALGLSRHGLFLHDVLDSVRQRLKETERPDAVGAQPVLMECALPPLPPDDQHHPDLDDGEDDKDLDRAEQQKPLELRGHAPTPAGALPPGTVPRTPSAS
jgi:hypothetical protein